jgi:hypothetical protein
LDCSFPQPCDLCAAAKLAAADPVEAQRRKYEEENKKKARVLVLHSCLAL